MHAVKTTSPALLALVLGCNGPAAVGDPCSGVFDCVSDAACVRNVDSSGGVCRASCELDAGGCADGQTCQRTSVVCAQGSCWNAVVCQ